MLTQLKQPRFKSIFFLTGCPLKWNNFRDKCYYFSSGAERLNFDETKELCTNKSSSMLIINDNTEQVKQNEMSDVGTCNYVMWYEQGN